MPRLTERELDLMQALWTLGTEASVAEVHAAMNPEGLTLAYTTVQTMLNRLAAKGRVSRRLEGRSYLYSPGIQAPVATRSALKMLAQRFFGGSVGELAMHLVNEEMSEPDIERVEQLLAQRRKLK
jgi:BlaI family penicillinase repressor